MLQGYYKILFRAQKREAGSWKREARSQKQEARSKKQEAGSKNQQEIKNKKKENTEFGYVADDGLGKTTLFLKMTGTIDDYKIAYDTEGLKESWKEDLKEEKQTLKSILNKEFGWFKKDSTLKKDDTPKDDGFQIEWEEDDNKKTETKTKTEKKKTKKKKKGLGKFIDKIAQPEDEEYEEFDDI